MDLIYHYTAESYLQKILDKGELIVSQWEKSNKIKPPALWLSTNPIWEHTATKMAKDEYGEIRELTFEEQFINIGLIRFVLEFKKDTLCSWAKYKYKTNLDFIIYEEMERAGIKKGANPKEWFASFKIVPLSSCISCEKWDGYQWQPLINFNSI